MLFRSSAGTFCWNEMATRDPETAGAFYCSLFGWTVEKTDCGDQPYSIFKKDDQPIAGMMTMDDNWPKDTPPHWGCYVAVDDVDAVASKVEGLGGKVCCGPQDTGEGGRFAVLTDPAGATISIYKSKDCKCPSGVGSFCWNELSTTDTDAACTFYTSLFGWTSKTSDMGEEKYTEFKSDDCRAGGMMKMHWEGNPSWLGYIHVANVDATTAAAVDLGAHVCVKPSDIPETGRFAVFTDSHGATIGVFTCLNEGGCDCSSS